MSVKNVIKYNSAWLLWAMLILYLLLGKKSTLPQFEFNFIVPLDKIVHIFLFFVLMLFLTWGIYSQKNKWFAHLKGVFYCFLYGAVFGALTEIMQKYFTTDREADMYDFFSDTVGLIIGGILFEFYFKSLLNKKRKFTIL